ncbi:endonuclease VII domain-containing protein [Streptomyces sp. NPDC002536]
MKRCTRCGEHKPRACFAIKRTNLDGLQRYCRDCRTKYHCTSLESPGKKVRLGADAPEGHKHCRGCGEVKPHGQFHRKSSAPDGLASRCKACKACADSAGNLRRKYGITEAQRDEMIASQMGLCCICLAAPAVQVDHCHKTGKVRGVLCFNCNSGLGLLRDDPKTIHRAIAYVEGNSWKPTLVAPGVYQLPS